MLTMISTNCTCCIISLNNEINEIFSQNGTILLLIIVTRLIKKISRWGYLRSLYQCDTGSSFTINKVDESKN